MESIISSILSSGSVKKSFIIFSSQTHFYISKFILFSKSEAKLTAQVFRLNLGLFCLKLVLIDRHGKYNSILHGIIYL